MEEIEAELKALSLDKEAVSVRMTGCPNGCARPYMGDIGIVGRTKDVYNIYVGGDWANTLKHALCGICAYEEYRGNASSCTCALV